MEGVSTNNLLQSDDFSTTWGGSAAVTANAINAPDGTATADMLDDQGASANDAKSQTVAIIDDSTEHTFSVFLKQGTAPVTRITLQMNGGVTTLTSDVSLTWADKSLVNGGTPVNSNIVAIANGWVRLSITMANNTTGNTSASMYIWPANWMTDGSTTGTVYAWGAQFENLPFASSYIPTTTAAVTRGADKCLVPFDENHPSIQAGNPFTMLVDAGTPYVSYSSHRRMLTVGYGETGVNKYSILSVTALNTSVRYYRDLNGQNINQGADISIKYRYGITVSSLEQVTVYIDGKKEYSEVQALFYDSGVSAANISIGCKANGGEELFGHVANLRIYDDVFTAEQMRVA